MVVLVVGTESDFTGDYKSSRDYKTLSVSTFLQVAAKRMENKDPAFPLNSPLGQLHSQHINLCDAWEDKSRSIQQLPGPAVCSRTSVLVIDFD